MKPSKDQNFVSSLKNKLIPESLGEISDHLALSLEFLRLFLSAFQISFGYVCMSLILTINLFFLGRNGKIEQISGIGLGNVWLNFTAMHMIYGLNAGFEIIGSKAFGSKKFVLFRDLKLKATSMIIGILCLSFLLNFSVSTVFRAFGFEEAIVEPLQEYVHYSFPGIVCLAFFDLEVESLNSQGCFLAQFIIILVSTSIHSFWCYIFVVIHGLEIKGIAIAFFITHFTNLMLVKVVNSINAPIHRTQNFNTTVSSKEYSWPDYLRRVVPIAGSVFFEIFYFELITLIVGRINEAQFITAHVIFGNLETFFYNFYEGYSAALASYVGGALGKGNIAEAKKWAKLGISGSFVGTGIGVFALLLFGSQVSNFFVEDNSVAFAFIETLPFFVIYLLGESLYASSAVVLNIFGQAEKLINLCVSLSYCFQIPMIFLLVVLFGLKLKAVWAAMALTLLIKVCFEFYWFQKVNWNEKNFDEEELKSMEMHLLSV